MLPCSPLLPRCRRSRSRIFPNSGGISPSSLFLSRFSRFSLVSSPNSTGSSQVKRLLLRFRTVNSVRLPNSAGIRPKRPLSGNTSLTTLPSATLTPFHCPRSLSVAQFSFLFQYRPSVASKNRVSASLSMSATVLSATESGAPGSPASIDCSAEWSFRHFSVMYKCPSTTDNSGNLRLFRFRTGATYSAGMLLRKLISTADSGSSHQGHGMVAYSLIL